jgi:hypothetical protein
MSARSKRPHEKHKLHNYKLQAYTSRLSLEPTSRISDLHLSHIVLPKWGAATWAFSVAELKVPLDTW